MTYPYVAGAVLLASDLNTDFAAKTDTAMTQNAQTGTTYSFALSDASKLLTTSNASPVSVTVTKQATVTWVTGTQLRVINLGAGVTTLVADTGVTINGNVALKQYQGGTLIRTASDVWLFVPTASGSGMDLITPTSVAGSGVTLSGGVVSFSAATTASVNGCFTTTYEQYLVQCIVNISATTSVNFRLRLAGTDSVTGYRYATGVVTTSAIQFNAGSNAASTGIVADLVASQRAMTNTVINGPALAAQTNAQLDYTALNYRGYGFVTHDVATAYDGFSLIAPSGNITGTLRIYGLRNS